MSRKGKEAKGRRKESYWTVLIFTCIASLILRVPLIYMTGEKRSCVWQLCHRIICSSGLLLYVWIFISNSFTCQVPCQTRTVWKRRQSPEECIDCRDFCRYSVQCASDLIRTGICKKCTAPAGCRYVHQYHGTGDCV